MAEISQLKKRDLPINWREKVQERLKEVEPDLTVQKISDIKRGKPVKFELAEKVLKVIREVKKEHDAERQRLRDLQIL